jgi:hypothetical protein
VGHRILRSHLTYQSDKLRDQILLRRDTVKPQCVCTTIACLLLVPCASRADFKYSETTKFTGGAVAGLLKFASKVSGKVAGPETSTYYLRGNRMRVEEGDGGIQIIDLDARHITSINSKKKTYGVITFDEMRAQLDQARHAADQEGSGGQLKLSTKVEVTKTQNTRVILDQATQEVQAKVDLQSSEGSGADAAGTLTFASDAWIAPSVHGYDEVKNFYQRIAREADWAPKSGPAADPRMAQAVEEMRKNSPALEGFSLLATVKLYSSVSAKDGSTESKNDSGSHGFDIPTTSPTINTEGVSEALGGLLSLHKHKNDGKSKNPSAGAPSDSGDNVLLTATTEVTSFSSAALDSSLFEIPAGYRQLQNKDK